MLEYNIFGVYRTKKRQALMKCLPGKMIKIILLFVVEPELPDQGCNYRT